MSTLQQPVLQAVPPTYQQVPVNKVVASKGWFIAKIVLGSCIILFDIILIGVSAGFLGTYPDSSLAFVNFIASFCPAIVSLCWQTAEFITVCVHRDRRGIHPGAHVGLHLILWLSFISTVGILAVFLAAHLDCDSYCLRRYGYTSVLRSSFGTVVALENTETAFSVLLTILHFTLFVRFCIECNRRNTMPPGVMVVAAPAIPGQGMYYIPAGQPQYMMAAPQPMGPIPAGAYGIQQPQPAMSGHTSVYGGFYNPNSQATETKVLEQQPSPVPALSEVSGDHTPHPQTAPPPPH